MPVTEFALIKLRGGHDELELLEVIMQCQELQDDWMRQHQPQRLDPTTNLSTMYYQQSADPPFLLITAPWDSPAAHTQWIESRENKVGFGKLAEYIAPDPDSVLLFHMEPAGCQPQLKGLSLPQESFGVCRISVEPGQKEALQWKYRQLEGDVRCQGSEQMVWAGWRIEKSGNTEDMVVFSSADVCERLRELTDLSNKTDHRWFKHVV